VSVIDTTSKTVVTTIPIGVSAVPTGVAVTPDGSKVYVTNFSGGGTGSVSVINAANDTVEVAAIPVEGTHWRRGHAGQPQGLCRESQWR
jgi:YVTN family beta-propeller protein